MNKKILIDQPGFWGDIIFVMAIAQKFANDEYEVDFPIFDQYFETPIQKFFPTINLIPLSQFPNYGKYNQTTSIIDDKYITLPFRASALRDGQQHMKNKYDILALPMDMWRKIQITRDYDSENKLFEILNIKEGDKYNFINENHQPTFIKIPIMVENEYKNVFMNKIEGFSIFDWLGVMEKAQSIHTIGTSIIFLIDVLENTSTDIHIYRRKDKDHSTYDFLLKKNYIYH